MFEELQKIKTNKQINKKPSNIYFKLEFDEIGVYISIVNDKNRLVSDFDYRQFERYTKEALKNIELILEKNSFVIDWEEHNENIYLKDNPMLLLLLEKSGNLVNEKMEKIVFEKGISKLKVLLTESEERVKSEVLFDDEISDFNLVTESKLFYNNKIFEIENLGENFSNLKLFNNEFPIDYKEKFLTLLFSYFDNIEIDYNDFQLEMGGSYQADPVIIFEKIDRDNSLYLKLGYSIGNIDFDFLNRYDITSLASINEIESKIIINDIDYADALINYKNIIKKITTHKKKLKSNEDFFAEEDLIILPSELAKEFLRKELSFLAANFKLLGSEKLANYKLKMVTPKLNFNMSHSIDFLEGDVEIEIEDEKFNLFEAINNYKKNSYIALNDGTNALIDKEYINKLERIFKKKNDKVKLSFFDLPLVDDLIEDKISKETFNKSKEVFRGFNDLKDKKMPKLQITAELRNYQKYGAKWLKYLYDNNLGGCLADDMGLGKTLQAISLLSTIYPNSKKPSLLIMPKSLLFNWSNEINRFASSLSYSLYYGTNRNIENILNSNLILTTYGTVRNDIEELKDYEFEVIILDESQNIKNLNSKSTKAVMLLKSKNKFALSGTPVENNIGELYSLFRFLNPSMFNSISDFRKYYADPIQKENNEDVAKELKKKIYPFILRRKKSEVLKDLPDKIEQVLYVEMNNKQQKLYEERRRFYNGVIKNQVETEGIKKSQFSILQALSELRQIASCPEAKTEGSIISPKREMIIENIIDAVTNNHKVLVFTNYINVIENLESDLEQNGIKFLSMTGATREREELVKKFQNDKSYKVFIMTLKTGGVGLNLTAADTIFIFDPWWNKAAENQAIDRAHRIGQDNTVLSYKIITKNTIEEKIKLLQDKKSEMFENLIGSDSASLKSMSEEDIEFILGD